MSDPIPPFNGDPIVDRVEKIRLHLIVLGQEIAEEISRGELVGNNLTIAQSMQETAKSAHSALEVKTAQWKYRPATTGSYS